MDIDIEISPLAPQPLSFDIPLFTHLHSGTVLVILHDLITLQHFSARWLVPLNYNLSFFPTSSWIVQHGSLCGQSKKIFFLCFFSQWKYVKRFEGAYETKEFNLALLLTTTHRAGSFCSTQNLYLWLLLPHSLGNCNNPWGVNISFCEKGRKIQRHKKNKTKNLNPVEEF